MNEPGNRTVTTIIIVAVAALVALFICLCCCGIGSALGVLLLSESERGSYELPPSDSDFRRVPIGVTAGDLDRALLQRLLDTPTHDTDYWVLHGQLIDMTGEPVVQGPIQDPTEYNVGDVHAFWLSDEEQQRYWQIDAELRLKTEHAYLYVDTETELDAEDLSAAADLFESKIYPTNHQFYGSEWSPGIDNDPRITILVTHQMPLGIAGYFSSTDEYPRTMKPYSNEREMFYVTDDYLEDIELFGQLLSHEFQHMIHWNQDHSESLWVNEGLSLLAEEINGYNSVLGARQYWRDPDIQLTNWAEGSDDRYRNYAASKLFLSYLGAHYGGYEVLARLAADDADGIDGVNNLLDTGGYQADFEAVFADWLIANLLDDDRLGEGRYDYSLLDGSRPRFQATLRPGQDEAGWVSPFGADYIEINAGGPSRVILEGAGRVGLTATDPHEGQFAWWSNRRNMLSSSLTRKVNLAAVEKATLHFWTWYDIEEHFDYGYVALSIDDGRTWQTLPGTYTTEQDPNQANYGYGYTGKSQIWLEERIDLSPYTGQEVLLRFWYLTDPGLNQSGWLVDDISIPEIGFADGGENDSHGWMVDGFVRSSNQIPQSYIVQLVEYSPHASVRRVELDGENRAEIQLGDQTRRAVLVISASTRGTSEAAPYRVQIR